jgi:hypothetical protein
MKRRGIISAALALVVVIAVATFCIINYAAPTHSPGDGKPFYVGVTYCGDSVSDAKLLVDRVANYTNLFVLQSGPFMAETSAVNEIGDYAVDKGLHFAMFYDTSQVPEWATWMENATQRWGDMFGGVYYADEPGGKILDTQVTFILSTGNTIGKYSDGTILNMTLNYPGRHTFYPNGTIIVYKSNFTVPADGADFFAVASDISYYPDGSVTIFDSVDKYIDPLQTGGIEPISKTFYTLQNGSDRIAQEETYKQVQSHNPIPNVEVAADLFIEKTSSPLNGFTGYWNLSSRPFPIFTSDYALYWWGYNAGYDMMLAQLGWNNSVNQEIGLVRGAAALQQKDWGTMITWKYMHAPYLGSGDEMYEQLKASYQAGATYTLIFNYAQDMSSPYGTLQDQHFDALQRFWEEVVENPSIEHGSVRAEAAFVLPKDYGWGMRNQHDRVWGIWQPFENCSQVWSSLQSALSKYGDRLDIVYEDPVYPVVAGNYSKIIYWNQTQ